MNMRAVKWAIGRDVRCAPTKLVLIGMASEVDESGRMLVDHDACKRLAQVSSSRLSGITSRINSLCVAGLAHVTRTTVGALVELHCPGRSNRV